MKKEECYKAALREIEIRLEKGGDLIGDLGNVAGVLKKRLQYYWIGFYFLKKNTLVLGPFQGPPACVFLPVGSGVCGTCVTVRKTIMVPDVHQFEGHIACDPNSKSEIVVPLFNKKHEVKAVLDVDSDRFNDFNHIDRIYLEKIEKRLRSLWG